MYNIIQFQSLYCFKEYIWIYDLYIISFQSLLWPCVMGLCQFLYNLNFIFNLRNQLYISIQSLAGGDALGASSLLLKYKIKQFFSIKQVTISRLHILFQVIQLNFQELILLLLLLPELKFFLVGESLNYFLVGEYRIYYITLCIKC